VHNMHMYRGYDENMLGPWSPATTKRASSLLADLTDFGFIVAFTAVHQTLSHLHNVTIKLQKRAEDIIEAYNMVSQCICEIHHIKKKKKTVVKTVDLFTVK